MAHLGFWGFCEEENCPNRWIGKRIDPGEFANENPVKFPMDEISEEARSITDIDQFQTISGKPETFLLIGGEKSKYEFVNSIEVLGKENCARIPL